MSHSSLEELHRQCRVTSSQAFAPGTWSNLKRHSASFCKFCNLHGLPTLPLSQDNVLPYLQYYSQTVNCFSSVANVFSSLKTWSKLNGHLLTELFSFSVNIFLNGLKRRMVTAVRQMLPVTPHLLARLHGLLDFRNGFHVCMWSAMLFLLFTFFRKITL